jgi:hypothetical protein
MSERREGGGGDAAIIYCGGQERERESESPLEVPPNTVMHNTLASRGLEELPDRCFLFFLNTLLLHSLSLYSRTYHVLLTP